MVISILEKIQSLSCLPYWTPCHLSCPPLFLLIQEAKRWMPDRKSIDELVLSMDGILSFVRGLSGFLFHRHRNARRLPSSRGRRTRALSRKVTQRLFAPMFLRRKHIRSWIHLPPLLLARYEEEGLLTTIISSNIVLIVLRYIWMLIATRKAESVFLLSLNLIEGTLTSCIMLFLDLEGF